MPVRKLGFYDATGIDVRPLSCLVSPLNECCVDHVVVGLLHPAHPGLNAHHPIHCGAVLDYVPTYSPQLGITHTILRGAGKCFLIRRMQL